MANVEISTLGATAFNGSFVNKLNTNLSNLANAVNNGVLWRSDGTIGQSSMYSDLNMNGNSILNGYVDGTSLIEIKNKVFSLDDDISLVENKSEKWAEAAQEYSNTASVYASQASASLTNTQLQAVIATTKAKEAATYAASVMGDSQQIGVNKANITALTTTVENNKTTSDTGIAANASAIAANTATVSGLSSTVTSNKASADATASSLATLTTTVTSNKTSADATASSLSTLSTTVSGLTSTVSSNTTTANAALPASGGTMTGAITMGSNVVNFGSYALSNNGEYIYSSAPLWSKGGIRGQQGVGATSTAGNIYNYYWNTSSEVEIWIDTTRIGKITVAAVSDKELKEDIEYVTQDALSEVNQWKPATFAYKARGILPKSDNMLGFIANDLVTVSPECVTGKGLGTDWDENAPEGAYELVPVAILAKLTRAVQQLSARVEALESSK